MVLLAMDWKTGTPPPDFVGFAIEYQLPGGASFSAVHNLKNFPDGGDDLRSTAAPFQKFRWVHFPFEQFQEGAFTYRVTPMFMDEHDVLTKGDPQQAKVDLLRETFPGKLNVCFTRGFVLSQAFVNRFGRDGPFETLVAGADDDPLTFAATHPDAAVALPWMGFEARRAILAVLDDAIADPQAQVSVIAYDLNEPSIVSRLQALGTRLRIIVDDSVDKNGAGHGATDSPESRAAAQLPNVKRQHMGDLQHNKTIIVQSPTRNVVVCGSTNFSWRGHLRAEQQRRRAAGRGGSRALPGRVRELLESRARLPRHGVGGDDAAWARRHRRQRRVLPPLRRQRDAREDRR